ncbi:TonB-dependent receptor [Hymenobacter cheonanensis]|uniref:TonB-dependent receptor n=1 Tax=Hymenobacter sp. CA2-7 TaxID=3063993 RepID=UPI002713D6F3|nr:TonB-dependent receptor [Hymenobacter sp. CA2-7]MDO7885841.1 TonB-dependent receptor [Hymenobacter sp. CA2-7]
MTSSRYLLFPLAACALTATAQAQTTGTVQGRITNSSGGAVEAVSVGLQGQPMGDITDEQGRFQIRRVAPGTYTLVVSAVGLKTEEQQVTVTAGQTTTVKVTLAESAAELKEVVVSGNRTNRFSRTNSVDVAKMPLKNVENPQVYSTVTKELLTEQLVFTADDATRNVPGIQRMWESTGRAGDGGSYYTMRGFVTQAQLRNGLTGNVATTIDAVNLDKLEVIKGPSGTLYGSSLTSYGGLLNRVTKRAYDNFGGQVAYAGGSYNFNRATLDLNTPLNAAKTVLFRVNGAWNYEKSFQDVGFSRTYALAPTLTIRPTEKLSITLDGEFQWATATGRTFFFPNVPVSQLGTNRADELPIDYRKTYSGEGLWTASRATNLFAQVNYQLSPAFRSSTNFASSQSYSDGFGPYFGITGNGRGIGQDSLLQSDQSTRNSHGRLQEIQQLFNGDFQLGSLRNRVVLGLDFLHVRNDQFFFGSTYAKVPISSPTYNYASFNGANMSRLYATTPPGYTYPVYNETNTYSAFLSDVLNLTDRFNVLAAVRVDRFANKGADGANAGYNQTAASPKFGAVYQLVPEQLSVFANYQNSFSNRGTYYGYNATTNTLTAPLTAKLEQANQVEAGVKFDRLGGRFTATLSVYNINVKNILRTDSDPRGAALFAQVQNGEQVSRGVEVDLIANPFTGFNVVAGFAYNHSELTNATADVQGRRPSTAGSPALANLWLSYRLSNGPLRGLGLGAGGNYASDNMVTNDAYFGQFTLPSFVVLNASAFYDQPRYRLSVKADNFTNTHYWIGYGSMNPQKLRSIIGQVALKF